jgi:hypothetical protein
MTNPASVPEVGGAYHLINTATYSDGEGRKPAWKNTPGVRLSCYLKKDARAPQELALNKYNPEVSPRVRQRQETDL